MKNIMLFVMITMLLQNNFLINFTSNTHENIKFSIQDQPIQDSYDERVYIKIERTSLSENKYHLKRKEKGKEDEVLNVDWLMDNEKYTIEILCEDGEDIVYEVYDENEVIASSSPTTVDSQKPKLHIVANGVDMESMPAVFYEEQDVFISWEDTHLAKSNIHVYQDGVEIASENEEDNKRFHVKEGYSYVLKTDAMDSFGHKIVYDNEAHPTIGKHDCIQNKNIMQINERDVILDRYDDTLQICFQNLDNINLEKSYLIINDITYAVSSNNIIDITENGEYQISYHFEDMFSHSIDRTLNRIILEKKKPIVTLQNAIGIYDKNIQIAFQLENPPNEIEKFNLTLLKNGESIENNFHWIQDNDNYVAVLSLQGDGQYALTSTLHDVIFMFQNKQVQIEDILYQIDTNPPVITILEQVGAGVFDKPQYVSANVSDDNLQRCELIVQNRNQETLYTKSCDENGYVEETFSEDNDYQIFVKAVDIFQHESISEVSTFSIDQVAPTINLYSNQKVMLDNLPIVSNKDMEVNAQCNDQHIAYCSVFVRKDEGDWQIYKNSDFTLLIDNNEKHEYQIQVSAQDTLGHKTIRETRVILNAIQPLPKLDQTGFMKGSTIQKYVPELTNINDQYQVVDVTLWKDNKKISYQWGDEIKEEGDYILDVLVADETMNVSHLQEPFCFSIDTTPPILKLFQERQEVLHMDSIKQGKLYVYLMQEDIEKAKGEHIVSLRINDEIIRLEDIKKDENNREYVEVYANTNDMRISAQCLDDANNQAEYNWLLHVSLTPFYWKAEHIGYVLCILAMTAGFVIYGKRKKN